MSQIVTLTFSPCLDKCVSVVSMIPGVKLKCSDPQVTPGGGGINVSRVLRRLGQTSTAIFPMGSCTGDKLLQLLTAEKVVCSAVPVSIETRENIIVFDENTNQQFRFGMAQETLEPYEWVNCFDLFEDRKAIDYIIVSGSLPRGTQDSLLHKLAEISIEHGARLIVDSSAENLSVAIKESTYLIKPNVEEFWDLAKIWNVKETKIELAALELINRSRCEIILISLGKEGAMLVTEKKHYHVPAPDVSVLSTVGAGDSMLAGIIYYLSQGESLKKALIYGVCCGSATTIQSGAKLCSKSDVDFLVSQYMLSDDFASLSFDW